MLAALRLISRIENVVFQPKILQRMTENVSNKPELLQLASGLGQTSVIGKLYWSDRTLKQEILGLGIAHEFRADNHESIISIWPKIQSNVQGSTARYLGGLSFNNANGKHEWQGFDAIRFSLPLVEISHINGECKLSFQTLAQSSGQWDKQITQIKTILKLLTKPIRVDNHENDTLFENSVYLTSPKHWAAQVNHALEQIETDKLAKIVLARSTKYQLVKNVMPEEIALRWKRKIHHSFGFLFNYGQSTFLGFSPERLLRQENLNIATESLAGTQARGATRKDDLAFETYLRNDQKLTHEHKLVTQYIAKKISLYSRQMIQDAEVNIFKLPHVQHRQAAFRARLNNSDQTPALLLELFPTPAVCGLPKKAAKQAIQEAESFERGWYAGAVGYIAENSSDFTVSIRSALLNNDELISYAGAGIVNGSEASAEWQELNQKSQLVQNILN